MSHVGNNRGAILVTTLRGHHLAITDMDVSLDNALLATASSDGHVRVWALNDGQPVAILPAHKDGTSMIKWSTLSPFKLTTCGEDGQIKIWNVDKAAIKTFGKVIAERFYSKDVSAHYPPHHTHERNNVPYGKFQFVDHSTTPLNHGVQLEAVFVHDNTNIKVKVFAQCHLRGQFASGTNNGFVYVWKSDDVIHPEWFNEDNEDIGESGSWKYFRPEDNLGSTTAHTTKVNITPLAQLRAHKNEVTEIKVSDN